MTYDTVRRLMPVTFRAVSLRRADEETTPGVHCLDEIAVKDKPLPEVSPTAARSTVINACAQQGETQPRALGHAAVAHALPPAGLRYCRCSPR